MPSKPTPRPPAVFPLAHDEEEVIQRRLFADADGERPTPVESPPARIPPHMRHLYVDRAAAVRGESAWAYRPLASLVRSDEWIVSEKDDESPRSSWTSPN